MILKKKNYLIYSAIFFSLIVGMAFYWAKAGDTLAAVATDINQSVAGKDVCYNDNILNTGTEIIHEKINCSSCDCHGSGKELFKFFGSDADCDLKKTDQEKSACYSKYPYGPGGTFAAAGNIIIGGGSLFLGEINRGAKFVLDKFNNVILSVGFAPIMTFSSNVAEAYRLKISNGAEIKGNLKVDTINFQGHDLKFITIDDKKVLYYED